MLEYKSSWGEKNQKYYEPVQHIENNSNEELRKHPRTQTR
jgi:hypothetical protein